MTGLASMTGYARAGGAVPGIGFQVEIKSVNARGLDVRMRLAPGFDALESEIRRRIGKAVSRGSITFTLSVDREGEGGRVVINKQALGAVLAALEVLSTQVDAERPRLDGILSLKGVLEQHESPLAPEAEEALHAAILSALDKVIADLVTARRQEGAHLAAVLRERVDEIAALTKAAELHPGRGRDAILERLRLLIAELIATGVGLSEDRLAQEALLLATKADIREELDRLGVHVASARQLIADGGPVGRKLDFLSQEFNREANTLCSKSNTVELTGIGLDLKAVIDQLREQVQNIE
ncbi:MAG: YicC/YloC family endoribonuclease [Devosia sp.]